MTARRGGLDSVLADTLAELANKGLDLDPVSRARLGALEGRRLQITVEMPPPLAARDLGLTVLAERLRFFPHAPEAPHAVIRGTPAALAAWALGGARDSARPSVRSDERLFIDGDVALVQELGELLRGYRPDLGDPLERLLGPDLAGTALGTLELAGAALRSALEGVGHTVREGGARVFVDRAGAERFLDDLDDLRLRIDRLAARVTAEERRRTTP